MMQAEEVKHKARLTMFVDQVGFAAAKLTEALKLMDESVDTEEFSDYVSELNHLLNIVKSRPNSHFEHVLVMSQIQGVFEPLVKHEFVRQILNMGGSRPSYLNRQNAGQGPLPCDACGKVH